MAGKNKTEKTNAPTAGGLVFERLGKDFVIPTIAKQSQFEGPLNQLKELPGEAVALFRCPYESARKAYTKAKAAKKQAAVMGIKDFNVTVRKMKGEAVVIAGIGLESE